MAQLNYLPCCRLTAINGECSRTKTIRFNNSPGHIMSVMYDIVSAANPWITLRLFSQASNSQNNICFGFHLFSRFNKLLGRIKVVQYLHKVSILLLVLLCFLVGSDGISERFTGSFFLPKNSYVAVLHLS